MKTFFVSRADADAEFASVIEEVLQAAGFTVILQQWDFANRNFTERMHAALAEGARVVALLSPEYLRSEHCQAEWQNAIADDPLNTKSRLILLRVAACEPPGLLSGLAHWDLVPIRDNRALLESIVLGAVREDRDAAFGGPYWRAPGSIVDVEAIRPVPGFSGREQELAALSAALSNDNAIAVMHGLGGVGKSSVAREYAWRNREEYSVVWWLNAQTESAIVEGLLRVGTLFVRGLDQLADRRGAAQQVTNSVLGGFAKPVLLIFDNLEDERLLRPWLPRNGSRALATSRNASWGAEIASIPVQTWSLETSISYLRRESGRADLNEADARTIAEALGALPLALAHAAASLRGMRMVTPARYLESISAHLKNAPRGAEYPRSVFATFSAAIAQAENEAGGAAALLCFAALFAPEAVPDELFRERIENYSTGLQPAISGGAPARALRSVLADDLSADEALGALDALSLLAFSETTRTYSIHRLVQLAARDMLGENAIAWRECAVGVADAVFPEVEFATWPQCERLLSHARAALSTLPSNTAFLPAGHLAGRCAIYLRERGEYGAAEPLQVRALTIRERACDADHPDVATSMNELATLYWEQGRYAEAEPLRTRALAIRERVLDPNHADVATSLNDLGALYYAQGRYGEAEPLYTRALTIAEETLGADHPSVGTCLGNLAALYYRQGRYEDAEPVYARALKIEETALGPDHPGVAYSLHNLASLYEAQERFREAEPLYARALTIFEKALGPDHPKVATSTNNLARVRHRQGGYGEAEPLYARALLIRETALGPDHPEVAISLTDLASLYEAQGRSEEAESLYTRALAIREKALGPDHPDVAISLNDLASLYEAQGRSEEAESLYARVLAIRQKALGRDHALTEAARKRLSKR